MDNAPNIGPYKATRLWNDVIFAFRQYLPCGRHRRYMKTFDNCFSGASATEWLLQYLKTNGNFGSDISREKATSLLNKLYRAGIFEEVKVSKSMRFKQDVQENRLYKFLPTSPSKLKISRLPLAPRNDIGVNHPLMKIKPQDKHDFQEDAKRENKSEPDNSEKKIQPKLMRKISILKRDKCQKEIVVEDKESCPPYHLVTRVLTTREIKDTWKAAFILRCKKVLGVTNLNDIISLDVIDGYSVMHNCIYLNKSGIVTNIDSKGHLPHWVMSAMKCLARWPEPPEPGLPSYPGFEKDVFGVVKEYFLSQEQPLVPYNLYDIITNVFVMAGSCQPRHSSPHHHYDNESRVPSTLWSSASLENIILNLTKKYCLLDNTDDRYGTHEDLQYSSHMNQYSTNYNQSTFPSTDGMNKLDQNHAETNPFSVDQPYSLSNQASCPSLSVHKKGGPSALSRTTQSAKETNHSDKWFSGISRKYGSAPNLKVSRYETAFGPDNRTVTRVFYHNGMTTDYGHDDVDLRGGSSKGTNDRIKSTNCLYDYESAAQSNPFPTERPVTRSKSFADVKEINRHDIFTEANVSREKLNTSFSGSVGRSSSFNRNSVDQKQNTNLNNSFVSTSREAQCNAHNKSFSISQQSEEPLNKALQHSFHSSDSHYSEALHNLSHTRATGVVESLDQYPVESHNLSSSQTHHSHTKISDPSTFSSAKAEIVSYSPTKEPLSVGAYGPGYRQKHNMRERPVSSHDEVVRSVSSAHEKFQEQRLSFDSSTPIHSSSSTLRRCDSGYRPLKESQVADYNVVLDASKKRSAHSSSDLASIRHVPSCSRTDLTEPVNQISRSYSLHCQNTGSLTNLGLIPALNLSNITPFYSMNSQSGKKTHPSSFMNYPQTRLSEDRVKSSLQMVTLLLPPANRRKLHLLLKMMVKMTANPNLCLDPTQTTRSLVLGTFYPAIIRSPEDCELDEVVQLQLVSFMMDFYDDIFTPPLDMKTNVSNRLKAMQRPQIIYSPKPERAVRFCEQASLTDFENQRITSSQAALEDLLEGIVSDQNMDVKEKKKRLQQFQRTYPTIYIKRFPNIESEAQALPQKPKLKQPLIAKPLSKLKSLRL